MARRKIDWAAVDDAVRARERVMTHAQLRELGLSPSTITRWIGPRGRWQRLLPGVVLAHRGVPSRRERLLGALLFAGEGAVITGADALRALGIVSAPVGPCIQVLVPAGRQRKPFDFVRVERTRRLPGAEVRRGIPYAPVARAAVDACRVTDTLDDVRRLVADVVQGRHCPVGALRTEILAAARQRTALPRLVLTEISAGVRSVAEAKAREVIRRTGVPEPLWNVELRLADGTPFCTPDAYWPLLAAAMEIDSLAWHLTADAYRRTKRRERLLTISGVLVIAFTPAEILDNPDEFASQVRTFLDVAARRNAPEGIVVGRQVT